MYQKAIRQRIEDAALYAVANAINTLWAIDIDPQNINQCRSRLLIASTEFMQHKMALYDEYTVVQHNSGFFAHLLCAISWHIHLNETLSSLSHKKDASSNAQKTKTGHQWFLQHGHRPLEFDMSWASYFENCHADALVPLIYKRASRFISHLLSGSVQKECDFEFANVLIELTSGNVEVYVTESDLMTRS